MEGRRQEEQDKLAATEKYVATIGGTRTGYRSCFMINVCSQHCDFEEYYNDTHCVAGNNFTLKLH